MQPIAVRHLPKRLLVVFIVIFAILVLLDMRWPGKVLILSGTIELSAQPCDNRHFPNMIEKVILVGVLWLARGTDRSTKTMPKAHRLSSSSR